MTEKIMRKKTIKCLDGNVNKNQLRTPMQFPLQFLMISLIVKVNMKPSLYSQLILIFFSKEY